MVNEIEQLRKMRSEVPERLDVSGAERRLAEMRSRRPVRRSKRAYRIGLAVAGGCAVAVTATVVATVVRTSSGDVRPVTPATLAARPGGTGQPGEAGQAGGVAVVLERAALGVRRTAAPDIRPDQWFYLKESQHMGGDLPTFESWGRMDGRRMALKEEGRALKVGPAEKGPTHVGRTQAEVKALPSDPDALLLHFRGLEQERTPLSICQPRCAPEIADDVKVFGAIGWYMKFAPMIPPDTVAGMYRALAKLPNVSVEENVADMDGRQGIGVVFDAGDGVKGYYILDPGDYHYMGTKVVREDGSARGMSVLGSGVVDEPGQVPAERDAVRD
ncbi:CU044_5270 family protein [Nonomuraea sp. NPDC050643]|uniref:CU044_5270 family protein n=1 Tax=Nonomuraea sp. NPDC050643 TaxID=3155660 RepID=UPI0033DC2958